MRWCCLDTSCSIEIDSCRACIVSLSLSSNSELPPHASPATTVATLPTSQKRVRIRTAEWSNREGLRLRAWGSGIGDWVPVGHELLKRRCAQLRLVLQRLLEHHISPKNVNFPRQNNEEAHGGGGGEWGRHLCEERGGEVARLDDVAA